MNNCQDSCRWQFGLLCSVALYCVQLAPALGQNPVGELEHHHESNSPPASGVLDEIDVNFTLLGADGAVVTDEDFRGAHLLLGFGFTRCTDVCPIMVANMARTISQVGDGLAGVFVSVDTERDSPSTVEAYAKVFHERVSGLSGSIEQINAAARNFRISYVVTKSQNSYTVQHTSHVFLIDPDGQLIDVFAMNTDPAIIAAAME